MSDLLLATGFQKPVSKLTMSDQGRVRFALVDYDCMLKVKSEMDAFAEGLQVLGVLRMNRMYLDFLVTLIYAYIEMLKLHLLELHHMQLCYLVVSFLVKLKDLIVVKFSVAGSSLRPAEEQAWVNFLTF